ncbi:MAG TPA: hypothetical protein VHJ20_12215 [Polyangia bacterium]|nr:hypothetical protein [Polyangia bacterium]
MSALSALGCGPVIKRDFSTIPPGQIGFDDMCGLQEYFDSLNAGVAKPPVVVSSLDLEGGDGIKTVRGGRALIEFQGAFLLKNLKRVLDENWRRLPEELASADKVQLDVRWVERAGVRRVVTDQDSLLIINGDSWSLPTQPCLSEFLYGEPLYKQRREMWAPQSSGPIPAAAPAPAATDGGAPPAAPATP